MEKQEWEIKIKKRVSGKIKMKYEICKNKKKDRGTHYKRGRKERC